MALGDFIKQNIKGGVKDSLGTKFGQVFVGLSALSIAQSNAKLKETIKLLRDIALFRIAWPFALVGIFKGIQGAIKGVVRETGSLEAAIRRLNFVRQLEANFTVIKRGAIEARTHVAALFAWSNRSIFNIEKVAAASRSFELMGRNVYTSNEALDAFGDMAAKTGNSIESVSSVVSTFFSEVLDGNSIDATTEEMRQMGIITSDVANRFRTMQRDGASASAMIGEMKAQLGSARGAMRDHMNDLDVLAEKYDQAKEGAKEAFGHSFVDKEKEALKAMTTILVALTPALTIIGGHLADISGAFSNITVRFLAWLAGMKGSQSVVNTIANAIGMAIKGLAALLAIGTARSFIGLLSGGNAASRMLIGLSALAGKVGSAISGIGSRAGASLGGDALAKYGEGLAARGQAKMSFATTGRPTGAAFGPLTAADAAQQTTNLANGLTMVRARALAAGAAMRVMGASMQLAAMAMKAIGAAMVWMLVLQVAVTVISKVTDAIESWVTGMSAGERAAKSMREETDKLTSSIQNQINSIATAEDRLAALAKVNEELAEAEKARQDLQNKGSALGDATLGLLGTERASLEELAAADERVARIKAKRQSAMQAPVGETEEEKAVRTADARREKMEREQAYQSRMSYYGIGGQLLTRQNRISQVGAAVQQGQALVTERARITKAQNELDLKTKSLEGKRDASVAAGVDPFTINAANQSIAGLKGKSTEMKRNSTSASISAEGEIEAIQAAITAANLHGKGDAAAINEAKARAGNYLGQDRESLMRQLDEQRNKRDRAKEVEDNLGGNQEKLGQLKSDQIAQILSGDNPVVSSLARIGLGGNTGESDMLSIARQHKDLTAQILAVLEKQQGIEEPGKGDTDLFGSY